jgi:small subunit ribosomal protein S19
MGRSSKKGPYIDPRVFEKVEAQLSSGKRDPIKTWSRSCTIVPEFIGLTFMVHNGKQHMKVFVTDADVPRSRWQGQGGRQSGLRRQGLSRDGPAAGRWR